MSAGNRNSLFAWRASTQNTLASSVPTFSPAARRTSLPRSGRELLVRHDDGGGLAVDVDDKRVWKSRFWRPPLPGLGVALCHGRARVCGCHGVRLKAR